MLLRKMEMPLNIMVIRWTSVIILYYATFLCYKLNIKHPMTLLWDTLVCHSSPAFLYWNEIFTLVTFLL